MIPPEVFIVPAVFGIPAGVVIAFRWFRHQETMAGLAGGSSGETLRAIEERLARVEQALESVAVEVERVGEGQRFVTGLLADRALPRPDPRVVPGGRVVTPH